MKAVVWTDYGRIEIQDVPVPSAGPLEVLVKVKACSLCTTDTVMIDRGIFGITPPRIIGHEVSGVVEAAGRGVTSLTRGDRVALEPPVPCRKCETCSRGLTHLCPHTLHIGAHTPGGMAELVAIDHRNAHRVPERLSFQEAALTEPVAVCLEALDRAGGVRGRTVALFGDGPFSMIFTKLAVLSGATKVLAIGHHEARLQKLRRYGAVPINSLTVNPVTAVRESTAGFGAEVIIEAIGSGMIVAEQCIEMLAPRGTLVLFADIEGKVAFDMHALHVREQTVVGSLRSLDKFPTALRMLAERKIEISDIITHALRIDEVHEGFRLIRTEKEKVGKVVISFEDRA